MNTKILYFTGTGNSLYISKIITKKIEHASLLPMVSILQEKEPYEVKEQIVGFVFPTHFLNMPDIVKKSVEKSRFSNGSYFFAVVTSGGDSGNTLFELNRMLIAKGCRLNYGIEIPLGDNSIAISTPNLKFKQRLNNADDLLDRLTQVLIQKNFEGNNTTFKKRLSSTLMGKATYLTMTHYYNFKKHDVDVSKCINCGLCQKVCPMNNIDCKNGEVFWGNHCAWCFACLNYCPNQAISFGRIHPRKDTQYHFPGVSAFEVSKQKS